MGTVHMVLAAKSMAFIAWPVILIALVLLAAWRIRVVKRREAEMAPKAATPAPVAAPAPVAPATPTPKANQIPAKGSLGQLELWDIDEPTAAMVMAIVADRMGAPLTELRFKRIRKVK